MIFLFSIGALRIMNEVYERVSFEDGEAFNEATQQMGIKLSQDQQAYNCWREPFLH
jgi:hypothetical protein